MKVTKLFFIVVGFFVGIFHTPLVGAPNYVGIEFMEATGVLRKSRAIFLCLDEGKRTFEHRFSPRYHNDAAGKAYCGYETQHDPEVRGDIFFWRLRDDVNMTNLREALQKSDELSKLVPFKDVPAANKRIRLTSLEMSLKILESLVGNVIRALPKDPFDRVLFADLTGRNSTMGRFLRNHDTVVVPKLVGDHLHSQMVYKELASIVPFSARAPSWYPKVFSQPLIPSEGQNPSSIGCDDVKLAWNQRGFTAIKNFQEKPAEEAGSVPEADSVRWDRLITGFTASGKNAQDLKALYENWDR